MVNASKSKILRETSENARQLEMKNTDQMGVISGNLRNVNMNLDRGKEQLLVKREAIKNQNRKL